jgi:hypothetical protein
MALQPTNPDFLSENSRRSFPFEDSKQLSEDIPSDCFLDLKGFSRSLFYDKVRLHSISKWATGSPKPTCPPEISSRLVEGRIQFFFLLRSFPEDIYIDLSVQISETSFPKIISSSLKDESGTIFVHLSGVVGSSALSIIKQPSRYRQFSDVHLEPSIIVTCYKRSLDQLAIERKDGTKEILKGDIVFLSGVNTQVSQGSKSISISAIHGAGEGRRIYAGDPNLEKCYGILTVNGVKPSTGGIFKVEGGKDIYIENIPSEHKIIVSIQQDARIIECPTDELP